MDPARLDSGSLLQRYPCSPTSPASPLNPIGNGGILSSFRTYQPLHGINHLQRLQIGYWTNVTMSNTLAAAVISNYLQLSHPAFGFFDANLFLDDLVEQRQDFCSPFSCQRIAGVFLCMFHFMAQSDL